jgi:hypothetical protein
MVGRTRTGERCLAPAIMLTSERLTRTECETGAPLSFAQERLWNAIQSNPLEHRHLTARLHLSGTLNRAALRAALTRIAIRHQALRTRVVIANRDPFALIGSLANGFPLTERDALSDLHLDQICRREAVEPFDLSTGPLIRARLLRTSDREHVLLLSLHLIVADRTSIRHLIVELSTLYAAFVEGTADPLPPVKLQYADYARLQRQCSDREPAAARCTEPSATTGPEPTLLPTLRLRPAKPPELFERISLQFPPDLMKRLRALCSRERTPLAMLLVVGWATVLERWSGHEEMTLRVRMESRPYRENEPLVGSFENTFPLVVRTSADVLVSDLLRHTRDAVAQFRDGMGWCELIERQRPMAHVVLSAIESAVEMQGAVSLQASGLDLAVTAIDGPHNQGELSLKICEIPERQLGHWNSAAICLTEKQWSAC